MTYSMRRCQRLHTSTLSAAILALGALAPSASAQVGDTNVRVLIRAGDVVSGETVTNIREPSIGADGTWAAICQLNGTSQRGLIIDGNLAQAEGDMTLDGRVFERFEQVRVSTDGSVALLFEASNPANPGNPTGRLRIDNALILQEGGSINVPALGVSGTIGGFIGMDYNAPNLVVGMTIRTSTGSIERAFVGGSVSGGTFTPNSGLLGGTVPAGSTSGIPYYAPAEECQSVLGGGGTHTATFFDGTDIYFGLRSLGVLLAEDGQPGAPGGSTWNFGDAPRVRANAAGMSVYSGRATLSGGQDRGVVYLDGTPLAVESGGVGGAGPFDTAGVGIAEDGTPFYSVPLNSGVEVLRAGFDELLRTGGGPGGTMVSGVSIDSLFASTGEQAFDNTPDGRTLVQRARLSNGDVVILQVERGLGDAVTCTTEINSTGVSGEISASGSRFLAFNDLTIRASELPTNSFGYLGISNSTLFVAMPGGSSGNLCIGPTVGRYVDQVQSSGPNGVITTSIDLSAVPQPTGFVGTAVGDTWYCQLWHRDSEGGVATSNFTDALSVTIQ